MNAVGVFTSETQINAKSCIQALLKTREYRQSQTRARKFSQRNINHFSGGFAVESQVFKDPVHTSADSSNLSNDQETSLEDVDYQNDFNYSQKLFHISDGNLYSILSPAQGRSYGMKPSFLRKQKYTVQECHSRGRKNLRKGLKFHNFLPSESVTSEKDNGILKTKWKVHSECRLREEHGTKQITISNWSHSVQSSAEDGVQQNFTSDCNSYSDKREQELCTDDNTLNSTENINMPGRDKQCDSNLYNFNSSFENNDTLDEDQLLRKNGINVVENKQHLIRTVNSRKGSLKSVLNSLLDKPTVAENSICDLPEAHSTCSLNQKHRRKPIQTRRVVPYTKYLSIIEEDDSCPLDLSSKSSGEKCPCPNFSSRKNVTKFQIKKSSCDDPTLLKTKYEKSDSLYSRSVSDFKFNPSNCNSDILVNSSLAHLLQNQIVSPLVFLSPTVKSAVNIRPAIPDSNKLGQKAESLVDTCNLNINLNKKKSKNGFSLQHMNPGTSFSSNIQYGVHKSLIRNSQPKMKRRSQRSVIKKNLEDTFKQNGFLVKTKQVSDGEATFCKFRQLRKYTRYYLKSWQQHLPDEVNKMWKGFLPPKTVLPPVSGLNNSTNGGL